MVAERDHVDAGGEQLVGGLRRDARAPPATFSPLTTRGRARGARAAPGSVRRQRASGPGSPTTSPMNRTRIGAAAYAARTPAVPISARSDASRARGAPPCSRRRASRKRYGERDGAAGTCRSTCARGRAAWRCIGPERRRQDDAAVDPRRDPSRRTPARCDAPTARSAGCRSSRRSTGRLTVAENLRLFARLEGVADVDGDGRRGCSSRPASRDRARRPGGARSPAATGSASTSRSACSPTRRCCCSTSRAPRSTRASASASGSSSPACRRTAPTVVYSTHTISGGRALRRPACSCSPTARRCSGASPPSSRASRARAGRRPRDGVRRASCRQQGPLTALRLLVKDLQILRALAAARSACWCVYPIVVALLIGLALAAAPEKPRVAFVNEVPRGQALDARRPGGFDLGAVPERSCATTIERVAASVARGGRAEGAGRRRARRADLPGGHRPASSSSTARRHAARSRCSSTRRTRSRRSSSTTRSARCSPRRTGALARAHRRRRALPATCCSNGGSVDRPRPDESTSSGLQRIEQIRRGAARARCRAGRRSGAALDQVSRLRPARAREPRRSSSRVLCARSRSRSRSTSRWSAARAAARHVRRRGRRGRLADVRHGAARLRLARARARGEHLHRGSSAGSCRRDGAAGREGRARGRAAALPVTLLMLLAIVRCSSTSTGAGSTCGVAAIAARRRLAFAALGARDRRARARGARQRRCSPSRSRCRSPSSRWSRRGRVERRALRRDPRDLRRCSRSARRSTRSHGRARRRAAGLGRPVRCTWRALTRRLSAPRPRRDSRLGAGSRLSVGARISCQADVLSRHTPAPPARRPSRCATWSARPSCRRRTSCSPLFVTAGEDGREPIDVDARHRAALDLRTLVAEAAEIAALGIPRRAAVRHPGRQGRGGLGRLRRRGRRADGRPGAQGGAPRARRDHRRLPLRVHLARPLRRRPRRRRGRQRPDARAARQDRDLARRGRRRRRRARAT